MASSHHGSWLCHGAVRIGISRHHYDLLLCRVVNYRLSDLFLRVFNVLIMINWGRRTDQWRC